MDMSSQIDDSMYSFQSSSTNMDGMNKYLVTDSMHSNANILDDMEKSSSNHHHKKRNTDVKRSIRRKNDLHEIDNPTNKYLETCDPTACLTAGLNACSWLFSEKGTDDDEVMLSSRGPLHPGAALMDVSRLLTVPTSDDLYDMLAEPERISQPYLAFATYRDGWSMENFLEKTKDREPVLILIRSLKNSYVIGAFSTSRLSPPSRVVRGDGECFVFRLSGPSSQTAVAYKWFHNPVKNKQGHNTSEQFLVATREYISFGASHEHGTNALRLDGDLLTCSSGPSDTYHNLSLTPDEDGPFQVRDIEVIQLGEKRRRRIRTRSSPIR